MASLFNKDPGEKAPLSPFARERIEREIAHLKKRGSVRDAQQKRRSLGVGVLVLAGLGLLWLFLMDPVLHGFKRGEAIRDYLYLHSYGSDAKARALAETGILTPPEVELLNRRQGAFQGYYAIPADADREADALIGYMNGVAALDRGDYARLDPVGKIRYQLFVRFGLIPLAHWSFLDPSVSS